jgi:hypothetical protein
LRRLWNAWQAMLMVRKCYVDNVKEIELELVTHTIILMMSFETRIEATQWQHFPLKRKSSMYTTNHERKEPLTESSE